MNSDEYYEKIQNALSHGILNNTIHELVMREEVRLGNEVRVSMQKSLIAKPALHNSVLERTSNHYLIEMNSDDIDSIVDFFFDLEAKSIMPNGVTTPMAALYSSLVDSWSKMRQNSWKQ